MNLAGAKINFLGDSITEGCNTSGCHHRFTDIIKSKYGLAQARNYGIGGTRYAIQQLPSYDEVLFNDFCYRLEQMDTDADAVVIFGGTNDFGHGNAPFGTEHDRTSATFTGACHRLFSRVKELYPASHVVVVTPLRRTGQDCEYGDGRTPVKRPVLSEYVSVIRKIAAEYDLPVLDLFADDAFDPNVQSIQDEYFGEGLHPNDNGHVYMAEKIGEFLKEL